MILDGWGVLAGSPFIWRGSSIHGMVKGSLIPGPVLIPWSWWGASQGIPFVQAAEQVFQTPLFMLFAPALYDVQRPISSQLMDDSPQVSRGHFDNINAEEGDRLDFVAEYDP
jgi:hypothetical protein